MQNRSTVTVPASNGCTDTVLASIMVRLEEIHQYVAGLKVAELREELKKHNQPTHGNKAALGQRLQETLERDEDGNTEENAAAMEAEDGKEGEAVAAEEEEEEEEEGGENAVGISRLTAL